MINGQRTILCIEDEQAIIDLVELILQRHKFKVHGVIGGQKGLAKIAELQPDLVLLDLMMPKMDGWEVYQKMKSSDQMRDIPVIVVTAKSANIDKVLGLHIAKVDAYITKPFTPDELLKSIDAVLDGRPADES